MPDNGDFLFRLRATFRVEAQEHVQGIASGLLSLEKAPPAQAGAFVEAVFREAHSLKGAARAVDDRTVERLCQQMEETFSDWRRGKGEPTPDALDAMHALLSGIESALAEGGNPAAPVPSQYEAAMHPAGHAAPSRAPPSFAAPAYAAPLHPPEPPHDAAGDTTVRVSVDKLETALLQAEELLGAKLLTSQRAADVRELAAGLAQWDSAWNAVQLPFGEARRGAARADPALARLVEFLEWNALAVKEFARRTSLLEHQLRSDCHQVDRLVDELLGEAKLLLLLPFASITGTFARLVRDLCREQGKSAQLRIEGGGIELDKRILEEIKDPLVHILRNAVDHGIEPAEERVRMGKPAEAEIVLSVSHLGGGMVEIAVRDDGRGIDAVRLAQAAADKGLIAAGDGAGLAPHAVLDLVFASEVSTSRTVTRVSGRGLGLAIVREKAEKLGGRVAVESEPVRGTAIRIALPATQATFRGILVMAGGQVLVLPTRNVERVVRVAAGDIHTAQGRDMFTEGGRAVPLVRLDDVLELPADPAAEPQPAGQPVLVLGTGADRVGFLVDRVIDEQEVLVKRLRAPLVRVRNVAGATVLGSGRVAPVLDVPDLLKSARKGTGLRRAAPRERPAHKGDVLIAEDSVTSRLLLTGILEGAGYHVRAAADGLEAFALLRQHPFDVLVSDVEMPGLGGFDLTARVRADAKLRELPVILVTALETPEDRERGLDAGADAYLAKSSFDQHDLLAAIERLTR